MRVLLINSYGGSLALAARAAGAQVVGSFEDAGFGIEIQKENFPGVDYRDTRARWPDDAKWQREHYRDAVVLAHPPCSAFSVQNNTPGAKGADSDAFKCTRDVLDYALGAGASALAVESVTAAMEGGAEVHEAAAKKYGYELHRILQNAILFGVPQWRERFWAVFVRKDLAPPGGMVWALSPRTVSLGDVLGAGDAGELPRECERDLVKLRGRLPLSPRQIEDFFAGAAEYRGTVLGALAEAHPSLGEPDDIRRNYTRSLTSRAIRFLSPGDYASVLMKDSWWWYAGRQMSLDDYSRVMGFPADYIWPGRTSQQRRLYLSKGVVPAVARWVLENIWRNMKAEIPIKRNSLTRYRALDSTTLGAITPATRSQITKDGEVALFRGARNQWTKFLQTGQPPVREE